MKITIHRDSSDSTDFSQFAYQANTLDIGVGQRDEDSRLGRTVL